MCRLPFISSSASPCAHQLHGPGRRRVAVRHVDDPGRRPGRSPAPSRSPRSSRPVRPGSARSAPSPAASIAPASADASHGCATAVGNRLPGSGTARAAARTFRFQWSCSDCSGLRRQAEQSNGSRAPRGRRLGGLLVLRVHLLRGQRHRVHRRVEVHAAVGRDLVAGDHEARPRLDGAERAALDARHLHEAGDRVAGHAQVVLQRRLGGVGHHLGSACRAPAR